MLTPGDAAPAFSLTSDSGQLVRSQDLKGRRYVLYFYPKDDTTGCTRKPARSATTCRRSGNLACRCSASAPTTASRMRSS